MTATLNLLTVALIASVFLIIASLTLSYEYVAPVPLRVLTPPSAAQTFGLKAEEYALLGEPLPVAPTVEWLNRKWAGVGCKTTLDERSGATFMVQTLGKAELEINRLAAAVLNCTATRAEIYMCDPTSKCLVY
jgi:hypothetical protein